jgi:hypothetical protein
MQDFAKQDDQNGIHSVDPVARKALIPAVIVCPDSESLPVSANRTPCNETPNAFQSALPFSSARPPSQGWRTFLHNHAPDIAAMGLFVVPTIGFDLLYAFVIVRLGRRDLVWINVTAYPTAD